MAMPSSATSLAARMSAAASPAPPPWGTLSKQTEGGSQFSALAGASGGNDPLSMISGFLDTDNDGPDADDLLNLAKKFF